MVMGTIDKDIRHGNHLPGTERYTRPEEIKALSKFLKQGISDKEADTEILQDNLEVPQDGRIGKPMYKEVKELSKIRENVFGNPVEVNDLGKNRLDLKKNPDQELSKKRLGIRGNEEFDSLPDNKLGISGNDDIEELSDKRLDIDPEKIEKLGDKRLDIKGNGDLKRLSETKLEISGNNDFEALPDTRLDIDSEDIKGLSEEQLKIKGNDNLKNLSETRLDIEENKKSEKLSEKRLDLDSKEIKELGKELLKIESNDNVKSLEKTRLDLEEKELKSLSKEQLQIKGNEDLKELSEESLKIKGTNIQNLDKEAELIPGKVEEIDKLEKNALEIEDKPISKLSKDSEKITPKKIDKLEKEVLKIKEKEVNLSEDYLEIEEKKITELSKEVGRIRENKIDSLSKDSEKIKGNIIKDLPENKEVIETKDIQSLSDKLETINYQDNHELSRKVETIQERKEKELSRTKLEILDHRKTELSNERLDIKEKEVGLSEVVEKINSEDLGSLPDKQEKIEDLRKEQDLSSTRLDIRNKEIDVLSEVKEEIRSNEEVPISDYQEKLRDDRNIELSEEKLEIEEKEVELGDKREDITPKETENLSSIRLDIEGREVDLSETKLDLQNPGERPLSDKRLDIESKEVELSDILLDLLEDNGEWNKTESETLYNQENSVHKLTNLYEITGLSDVRLDISNEDVELSDIVVKEPRELDIPLSDIVIKEPQELDIPLSDIVVKEPQEKEVPLSDIVIKEPRELDIPLSDIVVKEPSELDIPLSDIVVKEPRELDIPLSDIVIKEPQELDIPLSDIVVKEPQEKKVPLSDILKDITDDSTGPTGTQFGLYSGTTAENLDWLNLSPEDKNKLSEIKKLLEDFGEWGQKIDVYLTSIISGTVGQYIPETKVEAYKNLFNALPDYSADKPNKEIEDVELSTKKIGGIQEKSVGLNGDSLDTPPYKLGKFNLLGGGLAISKYLRWLVENTVGKIPVKGTLKQFLLDETLWLLIEARNLAEKATDSRPFRLPRNSIIGTAASMASKGITIGGVLGAAGNLVSDAKMKPYNGPNTKNSTREIDKKRKEWVAPGQIVKDNDADKDTLDSPKGGLLDKAVGNLMNSLDGDPSVSETETRSWLFGYNYDYNEAPDADGIKKFGVAISQQYLLSKGSRTAKTFDEFRRDAPKSYRLTTPEKFTSTYSTRNYFTLDSNHVWEVIIRPYTGELNGKKTWLPSIAEIDLENKRAFNITTHYSSGWLPITGYELQSRKITSKELALHSGNIYFPIGMELTNELRLTFADDSLKSIRRYFELAAKTSVYMSNIHDTDGFGDVNYGNLIEEAKEDPTVIIEGRVTPAHYKNVSFLIDIFSMTPQFATINRTQLLCVLKDFMFEGQGETDASPTELAINFSIVGEWPSDMSDDNLLSYSENDQMLGNRPPDSSNSLLNNLGGVLSSF